MSPALIRQLLDIATLPDPELMSGCCSELLDLGLIVAVTPKHGDDRRRFWASDAGNAYLVMLTKTPLPIQIQVWVDPRDKRPVA